MSSRIGRSIDLNNERYQTSVDPLGIALFFHPNSTDRDGLGAGYLFPSYTRNILISGSRNETVFWDLCQPCPLYNQKRCSGGYKVLSQSPTGPISMVYTNAERSRVRLHYYKDFCTIHQGSDFLDQALRGNEATPITLLPHFMYLKGNGSCYWQLFRPDNSGNNLEFMPYRIFNTHGGGEICFGGNSVPSPSSIPSRYETFLGRRMNEDLNPTGASGEHQSVFEWATGFTPEKLMRVRSSMRWRSPTEKFGPGSEFIVLPPNYKKVKFINLPFRDYPLFLREANPDKFRARPYVTMPVLQASDGAWYSPYDLQTPLNSSNSSATFLQSI